MVNDEEACYATLEPTQGGQPIFSGYDRGDSHGHRYVSPVLGKQGEVMILLQARRWAH